MIVKIGKQGVDVLGAECVNRECLRIGTDYGPYAQGRGYTDASYKSRLVCLHRHLRGCPSASVCPTCQTCSVDPPGTRCTRCPRDECGGVTVALRDEEQS